MTNHESNLPPIQLPQICHRICDGCETGRLRAESTDRLNAQQIAGYGSLREVAHDGLLDIWEHEATQQVRGTDPDVVKAIMSAAASSVGRTISRPEIKQVMCEQDGPHGLFQKCGAQALEVSFE